MISLPPIFKQDPYLKWPLRLSGLLLLTSFGFLVWFWSKLPPVIPFFYSLPWGEEQLASPLALWISLTATIVITVVNNLLVFILYKKSTYLAQVLSVATFVINLLIAIAIIRIILLVI